MNLKILYLCLAVLGTILPWAFFGTFLAANHFDVVQFLAGVFANGASTGFAVDLVISIVAFFIWSFFDARKHSVSSWWVVLPSGFLVGLSLALPLYLYLRHDRAVATVA